MVIVKAVEQDSTCIMNIITECTKSMEAKGINLWNKEYPNWDVIKSDIINGSSYIAKSNNQCIAYVAIDEQQPPEYEQIHWSHYSKRVLVIHRLSVHPNFQGLGVAKKLISFIEDIALKNNYACIRFDVYSENTSALKLYECLGYIKKGKIYFPFKDLPFYCFEKLFTPKNEGN